MKLTGIMLASLLTLAARQAIAGDAGAMGYRYDGVWTAVTYNRSSTPKGGSHYREADQACAAALRDLHTRGALPNDPLVRTKIIGKSNQTGYVAVAHGKGTNVSKEVTAIGRGKSQLEADRQVLQKLDQAEATREQRIAYRYFSYGTDSKVHQRAGIKTARR